MKIDREKLKGKAEIRLINRPAEFGPEGSFAYDTQAENDEVIAGILRDVENGNDWAWCDVEVRAEFADMVGCDHLGGCSYENEKEFTAGGYYDDMVNAAVEELAQKLERAFTAITVVHTTDPTKER